MRKALRLLLLAVLTWSSVTTAEELLMVRSSQSFPEAMLTLQQTLTDYDYTVSRVQRVDVGLTAMGYETDKYRVVFFGKLDEIQALSESHPEMIPYLQPKIAIFAEGDQTLLVTSNPGNYKRMFPDSALATQFDRWESDLRAIFEEIRRAE